MTQTLNRGAHRNVTNAKRNALVARNDTNVNATGCLALYAKEEDVPPYAANLKDKGGQDKHRRVRDADRPEGRSPLRSLAFYPRGYGGRGPCARGQGTKRRRTGDTSGGDPPISRGSRKFCLPSLLYTLWRLYPYLTNVILDLDFLEYSK